MCGSLLVIVSPCEFFNINFPLPLWDVFVLLSVHTFLPNPLSLCMGQFSYLNSLSLFPFSVSATFYLLLSLSPRAGSTASGLEDIH